MSRDFGRQDEGPLADSLRRYCVDRFFPRGRRFAGGGAGEDFMASFTVGFGICARKPAG